MLAFAAKIFCCSASSQVHNWVLVATLRTVNRKMTKLIFLSLFFLLSLLVLFRAPTNLLWYVSILVTEFSWVFVLLVGLLLLYPYGNTKFHLANLAIGFIAIFLLLLPYWQAWRMSKKLQRDLSLFCGNRGLSITAPFRPLQVFTGINARKVPFKTLLYDTAHGLTLDFYAAEKKGNRPLVLVVHGGSWAGGDSQQLPELNSEMAKWGYHVASINYRLAPKSHYPAQVEDVQTAVQFLKRESSKLFLDASRIVILGRSAGGQIALSAAYTLHEKSVKGVIDFYGPTDMVWGYDNPTNPLVLNSRKVMEDYLGGTLSQVPEQYVHSSATETVTTHTPPTLMIYAENDPLVSPRHGNRLGVKLDAFGIRHYALYLPWATHGFDYTLNGPGGQLSTWAVKQFLAFALNNGE